MNSNERKLNTGTSPRYSKRGNNGTKEIKDSADGTHRDGVRTTKTLSDLTHMHQQISDILLEIKNDKLPFAEKAESISVLLIRAVRYATRSIEAAEKLATLVNYLPPTPRASQLTLEVTDMIDNIDSIYKFIITGANQSNRKVKTVQDIMDLNVVQMTSLAYRMTVKLDMTVGNGILKGGNDVSDHKG